MTAATLAAPAPAPAAAPARHRPRPKKCPHPEKKGRYPSEAAAWRAAWITTLMSATPLYFYPCRCGQWHLTKDSTSKSSTEPTR